MVLDDEESSGNMGGSTLSGMALLMSLVRPSRRSAARRVSYSPVGWPFMSSLGIWPVRTATSWSFKSSPIGMDRRTRSSSMTWGEALGARIFGTRSSWAFFATPGWLGFLPDVRKVPELLKGREEHGGSIADRERGVKDDLVG